MFKLIALLFLVTNGVVDEKPSMAIGAPITFASESECNGFLKTKDGTEIKKQLNKAIAQTKQKIKVKFRCVELETEDNTI